jgi:hypothetical protein
VAASLLLPRRRVPIADIAKWKKVVTNAKIPQIGG